MRLKIDGPRLKVGALRLEAARVLPVYKTAEYRAWRSIVIGRAGGVCQMRGCGRSESRMYADHIAELKDGGAPFDPTNGQCLCGGCHNRKTALLRSDRQGG